MSLKSYCSSSSDASNSSDDIYCIFLHINEAVGLTGRDTIGDCTEQSGQSFLLKASLNGVQFKTEGHSMTQDPFTKFKSNFIWECKMNDIKRMKLDNRPIKLECFCRCGQKGKDYGKLIGSLLLRLKYIKIMTSLAIESLSMKWHQLGALATEWRDSKPEINLMLAIVKKYIIERGQMDTFLRKHLSSKTVSSISSTTAFMLQSQGNIYVQLLEQDGVIQVGNKPDKDIEIFLVTLTFKYVRNIRTLLRVNASQRRGSAIAFSYDLLGQIANIEIATSYSSDDCYAINEKLCVRFKSSLQSLRTYFEEFFYIPICIYSNEVEIVKYRISLATILPEDTYFDSAVNLWTTSGTFNLSAYPGQGPFVDYVASVQKMHESKIKYRNKDQSIENVPTIHEEEARSLQESQKECRQFLHSPQSVQHPSYAATDRDMSFGHYNNLGIGINFHHELLITSVDRNKMSVMSNCEAKSFHSSSTNTDSIDFIDYEGLSVKVVEELEQWKSQQMETFLKELSRREQQYMDAFQHETYIVRTRLKTRIAASEQLSSQLQNMMNEFKDSCNKNQQYLGLFDAIRRDIQYNYEERFKKINAQMDKLRQEIQEKSKASQNENDSGSEVKAENAQLKMEATELKGRIEQLQHHLTVSQTTIGPVGQLINIISDLRNQNERFIAAEQTMHHYQCRWIDISQEINKLTLQLLNLQDGKLPLDGIRSDDLGLCLREILNDEQDVLPAEWSGLKSPKKLLFNSIDISSDDDGDDNS